MSLPDLQAALGTLIAARTSATRDARAVTELLDNLDLTGAERAWLAQIVGSPGFEVTCYTRQWWRKMRLKWSVRLTLAALGRHTWEEFIEAYLESTPCTSLFFIPEALDFLDFVINSAPEVAHLESIARFERALLVAAEAVSSSSGRNSPENSSLRPTQFIGRHSAASVVDLSAPPELLFSALLHEEPLPPPGEEIFRVLVAPGLPYLWRPITSDEVRLFTHCQTPITVRQLLTVAERSHLSLDNMLHVGALIPHQDCAHP